MRDLLILLIIVWMAVNMLLLVRALYRIETLRMRLRDLEPTMFDEREDFFGRSPGQPWVQP